MIDFNAHSLKNYTNDDVKRWTYEGMVTVAKKMGISVEEFTKIIAIQNREIDARAKFPTIDINTPERINLRNKIIADYFDCFCNAKKQKTAIVVLGQIASGKSSFCTRLVHDNEAFIVDADYIKQGYGLMSGLSDDFDNGKGTNQIHEEASMLSKKIIQLASDCGYNLVIPKTGINYSSIEGIVTSLKNKGYYVGLAYIDLPIKKCIERNYFRYIDEMQKGKPARLIDFDAIKRIDDNPFKTYVKFLCNKNNLVDDFAAFSNDVEAGQEMQQISTEEILKFANENKLMMN